MTEVRSIIAEASALVPKVESRFERNLLDQNVKAARLRLGDVAAVAADLDNIKDLWEHANQVAAIASEWSASGDWKGALRFVDERLPLRWRTSGYLAVARTLDRKGNLKDLEEVAGTSTEFSGLLQFGDRAGVRWMSIDIGDPW